MIIAITTQLCQMHLIRYTYRCYELMLQTYPETGLYLLPRRAWLLTPTGIQILTVFHLRCIGKLYIVWQTGAEVSDNVDFTYNIKWV